MSRHSEQRTMTGWVAATLQRAKRIPPLNRLLKPEARALPPEEAARERKRHEELTQRLAPDAKATEAQLQAFIERQNREFEERQRASGGG